MPSSLVRSECGKRLGYLCQKVVLALAWTLADLGHREAPDTNDIGQALGLRQAAAAAA
ncbi:hypothetical protein ACTAQI_07805 [Pseudarthrobacter sp. alpha12b]